MLQNRTNTQGFLSQIIETMAKHNQQTLKDLFKNIMGYENKQKRTLSTQQQIETKVQNQIQDETVMNQDNKMYNSYIHEQIPNEIEYQQPNNHNKQNQNQIQQLIEIYNSKVIESPIKSNKSPDTHRKKVKSTFQDSQLSNHQKLLKIERQKQRMQEQLKRLNEEMKEIKREENQSRLIKKQKDVSDEVEAAEQAQRMLIRIQKQRRQIQQKKNKDQLKFLQQLQKETTQKESRRREYVERLKSQKRDQIMKKLQDKKKERQQKSLINKQSNRLIKELKKSQSATKHGGGSLINNLVQKKKSLYMNRNLSQKNGQNSRSVLTQQPRKLKEPRSKSKLFVKKQDDNGQVYPKPIVHYPKGKFLQILQQQQKRKKQSDKQKQVGKKQALEKRIKYGQLIKNLFVPIPAHNSKNKSKLGDSRMKPPTPDVPSSVKERTSFTRKTQNEVYRKQAKSKQFHNKRQNDFSQKGSYVSKQDSQQKRKKEQRLRQIRKQTLLRIKKAQKKQSEVVNSGRQIPKVQKYSNYLKQLPKPKNPQNSWKKVLENQNLSKQQKYSEMLSHVNQMENKAKLNQKYHKGDGQAMNLIIGSIQAKLALLDQL